MCGTEYITFQIHFFNVFAVFHSGLLCGQNRQRELRKALVQQCPLCKKNRGQKPLEDLELAVGLPP
jgi:hypothetical protein